MSVRIYFESLDLETRKAVLEEAGVEKPEDMNWDTFPLFIFECEKEEE